MIVIDCREFFVILQSIMKQDIYEEIIEPLDSYLNGSLTEKDVDWSALRWCAKRNAGG